ncbi:phage antirepressor KilAC domain-containing protein [Priestia flexa]|uniref:phage antirepressor KilAC domain-containing protein n=1 Tax=Priestia flexa TaxID=86664 RepID=UPI003D02E157
MHELMNNDIKVTSRDIAEWTGKRHDNVMRDIRQEVEELGEEIGALIFEESSYINSQNKKQPCYKFGKKGTMQLILKYDAVVRYKVIEKIEELENGTKQQYKTPTSLKEALLLSVQLIEQNEKLESHNMELSQELSITKPKADYYDQILASDALVTTSTIAQDYGFRSPQALNNLLHKQEIQYRKSGQWFLYAKYKEEGYMHSHTYQDGRTHNKWTQKGRLFLHKILTDLGYKPVEAKLEEVS